MRRHGLGLRAQIILALIAAFALSFAALGLLVVQVARRSAEIDRVHRARTVASALSVSLQHSGQPLSLLVESAAESDLVGVAVSGHGDEQRTGDLHGAATTQVRLEDGRRLAVWLKPVDGETESLLGRLLRLYLLVTFAFILLLTYVLLTRLIVRPVENLTRASERLAEGVRDNEVPVAGAAEVARLAVSFNHMAAQLRGQKAALEARLQELEHATAELRSTRDQLVRSEKLASVGRLSAGIAHEIGNPLAAISGLTELLQLGGLAQAEHDEFLARIRGETERIHRIIRELLDYSRARPSVAPQADEPGNVANVIEEAVKLIAPQKDLRRVNIETRLHDERPLVRAPAHELTQVLLNLLLNATDAVNGEGTILIELTRQGERIVLSVSDTGPGIPDAALSKIFDPFFTTKPPGKGTGLGLAVCQSLVERFGGKISAENAPGGGARFTVSLPAA